MNLEIQSISITSVEKLSKIATQAYFDHYKHLWYDEGTWYADKCFNTNQLSAELLDRNNHYFLAIFEEKPVGFLKLRPENQLIGEFGNGLEIERIYLTKEVTGRGVGRKLMEFAIEFAKKQHKEYVWLKAMDSSKEVIRFYESLGFEVCGSSQLDFSQMKTEYLGMVTMKRK